MKSLFRYKLLLLNFLLIGFYHLPVFGQAKKELEKTRQENIQKLEYSRSLLEKTEASKNVTVNQINLIQQNIQIRTNLIENITEEISFLKNDISVNNFEIKKIEDRISALKKEYSDLIIAASRNLDKEYAILFLFSSEDFNQAYQRIKYLKYLSKYRSDLVLQLINEEEKLVERNQELQENKIKNERLLKDKNKELASLDKDKKKNLSLVKTLQNKEGELRAEIKKRERIQAEVEKEIKKLILEEAARAKNAKNANILTPAEKLISGGFQNNMGRLPWPSEQGMITTKFGEQNHPVLKGIKIKSNGIDINTVENAKVRCVFEGEVTKVIAILGANYTVIVKHGDFRTVYQNLVDVTVKAGDKVQAKQILGTVFTDLDYVSKFHFEVWQDKNILNPELWLSK